MIRYVIVLLGVAVTAHATHQCPPFCKEPPTPFIVAGTEEIIGNKTYFVGNPLIGVTWNDAEQLCMNKSMAVVGLETQEEQDILYAWFVDKNINGKWWTNGMYRIASDSWEWGTSGVYFTHGDKNWSSDPVKEPDGDAARWAVERVAYGALSNAWYADNMITELNHAICE